MQDNNFWPSYADLMTSLFFIMMVLYILTFVKLKTDQEMFRVAAEKYEKLKEIEESLQSLDKQYFDFDENNKRFRLNIDTKFNSGSSDIDDFRSSTRGKIVSAGHLVYNHIDSLSKNNIYNVEYLIIIEGNAQRNRTNWRNKRDYTRGYELSYSRAFAFKEYWKEKGIDFEKLDNVEVLLAGSGHFGKSRVTPKSGEYDSNLNRRFTIQITSKIGDFK